LDGERVHLGRGMHSRTPDTESTTSARREERLRDLAARGIPGAKKEDARGSRRHESPSMRR
jgi:hypothetical protein